MAALEIRDIFKDFESVELFYIKVDHRDGSEGIWRKCTIIRDGEEKVIWDQFYFDGEFHNELDTPEKLHTFLVDFLHEIEETRKEDIDEDDNTIITFTDDDQEKEAGMNDKKVKEVYYCEYDGMVVFRMKDDSAVTKPLCECPECEKTAVHVNAYSYEFIAYGYTVV